MLADLEGFVFDLDGCVWNGDELNPGAGETLAALARSGRRLAFLSNNSRATGADLVLFPELAVTGYPPEDLLLRPGFLRAVRASLEAIAAETNGLAALVGTPHLDRDLFNGCAVCVDGEVRGVYRKMFLPNYGVFDEDRYFQSGRDLLLDAEVEAEELLGLGFAASTFRFAGPVGWRMPTVR